MSDNEVGAVIEGLGCEWEAGERLPALAVVLLKTIEPDGTVGLSVVPSEGCDWVNRVGLLQAALNSELRDLSSEQK
jgi:hypothetical protein